MEGTPSPQTVSTKQQRIAKEAKEEKRAFNTLAHNIDVDWLKEAFRRTRKDGAPGIDGLMARGLRDATGRESSVAAHSR